MRAFFIVAFLMASLLTTRSVGAQEVLTNESVVEMVKAGLSERVIIAKIRNSPTKFGPPADRADRAKKDRGPGEGQRGDHVPGGAGGCRRAAGVECSGRERGDGAAARRGPGATDGLSNRRRQRGRAGGGRQRGS